MKKQTKRTVLWSILAIVAVLVIVLAVFLADLSAFPGNIKETGYQNQVVTSGVKSTFHDGVIYRYPGIVPMMEVAGDYYEMGLQYGVLLRPEILNGMDSMTKILKWNADEMGVPYPALVGLIKYQARQMAAGLPQKYQDEMKGVSNGSGVPYDTVISCCLFYDIGMGMGCTGVLMRGSDGSIIQGRNNDTAAFGGEELAKMTVVVRYKAKGANVVTHMDQPFYMGVETGYSDKGLTFGEETLYVKKPDPNGFSLPYLIRIVMEEASTLDQIYPYFDKYHTIGAYGCVWGDIDAGRGAVVQLTPTAWVKNELKDSLLWNFNRLYDQELAKQQVASVNVSNSNIDREAVASTYPQKPVYTIDDVVKFVRAQIGPDGTDYSWCGTKRPVCNWAASQMMIFDTKSDGFYMAVGPYYAARQNIYHFYNDFSKQPELFMPAVPIEPVIEKAAQIENRLVNKEEKLKAFIDLAQQYKDDANVQFLVAYKAFKLSKLDIFTEYAEKAYDMDPANSEYQMYAGIAAYQKKDLEKAVGLLDGVTARYPEQDLIRLTVLEKASTAKDPQKAAQYTAQKQAVLDKYGAESYYNSAILPLINALDKDK
ncbi:MAG: C45 family autoproteolytic acyltransferase/hydrolase [Chloroflexi bacterium]|nr:C45 family autoproteolytic acyltransferase/hydrolase [Chloroflexota bacterium]